MKRPVLGTQHAKGRLTEKYSQGFQKAVLAFSDAIRLESRHLVQMSRWGLHTKKETYMRTQQFLRIAGLMLFLMALALPVHAQVGNQGSIEGTIADQKGGVVPGATVTVRNTATDAKFSATTDESGYFHFLVLPVGTYELTVEKSGFATITQKEIPLRVGAKLNFNLSLPLAAQQASVVVTGETPVVETTRTQVSSTVDDRAVANLPVNGRNFIDFVLLTPGVTRDVRLGDISFAGQRGTLNSLVIDGSDNNNTFFGQATGRTGSGRAPYQFSQDAVQEFQVNSNSYSAELGHAGGAVINVITKSGSNEFHGSVFEFFRDKSLNANDLINKLNNRERSPLHFHQFGGTLGGPIVKDKLFFLFDYDGQRNTLPNLVFLQLPGGFVPTTPNQIAAINYLTARANPWTRTQNQNVYLGKIDWHISSRHLLTGRWNSQRFTGGNFENGGNQNAFEHTGASKVTTDTLGIAFTSTLTSSTINVARFTYLRDNEPGQANNINPDATINEAGRAVLIVGRNTFSPRFTNIKRAQWGDTLAYVNGRHSFKVGVDFIMDRIANFFPGNFSGSYTFNSLEAFGANLNGAPAPASGDRYLQAFAGSGTSGPTTNPNIFEVSGFAQDEWRARSNLTLTFGWRYDVQRMAQPSVQNPAALPAGIDTKKIPNDYKDIGPRVGFAWTPFANNRTVVRGGYGIYYGRTPSIMVGTAHSNNGLNIQTLTYTGAANIPLYPNTKCGAPVASPSCAPPPGGTASAPTIFVFEPNYRQPQIQQGSFGVETEVVRDLSVSIGYLWVKGTHVQRTRDINLNPITIPVTYGVVGGSVTSVVVPTYSGTRPLSAFSRILEFEGSANSVYHGLTIQANKRFSHNFQVLVAYTYGKVIDDVPDATAVVPGTDDGKLVQFPTNTANDRAAGYNDQRHRFVASYVWDWGNYTKGVPGWARFFLGGWEFSGIITAQSGQPYSGLVGGAGSDINLDGNSRTDRFPGLGRDTFRLPRTVTYDPRATKNFRITERARFQLIGEMFNAFNHVNIIGVNTTQYTRSTLASVCGTSVTPCLVKQATFGAPTLTIGPRIIQLAAKFIF